MKYHILNKTLLPLLIIIFLTGIFPASFSFTGSNAPSPKSGGWQLQTNLQTLLNGRTITDMAFLDSLTGFAVTNTPNNDTSFIIKTTNGGNNWFRNFDNIGPYGNSFLKITFVTDSIGYACGGGGYATMCKTTNRGGSWSKINYTWATAFFSISILGKDTIYVTDDDGLVGGVFRSTNGGGNWQRLCYGMPYSIYMINAMTGFCFDDHMYKTTDGGYNWTYVDNVGFRYMKFFDSLNGYRITISNSYIQKTTNSGINWSTFTLPNVPGISTGGDPLRHCFEGKDTIWVSGRGVWYPNPGRNRGIINMSTNGGLNWGYQIPDTSFRIPEYEFINFLGPKIGLSYNIFGAGIHTTVGGDSTIYIGVRQISTEVPERYSLEQNYPNPFNPITNIKFQILNSEHIKLIIHDITGREISELVDENLKPGVYQTKFDGSFLSSGVYFYSLYADGKRFDTKKMVMIK